MSIDRLFARQFADPGCEYRGAPFWAWNGKLEPAELRRQVRIMKQMGLGGFFMHSRVGLATEYLSDEWFECVQACIDEAGKQGMMAWLYDEDRWPSGAAGGIVTCNPKYRMRYLGLDVLSKTCRLKWDNELLGAFVARVDGHEAAGLKAIARGKQPLKLDRGESLLLFRVIMESNTSWYNGYTYLDTMNHDAVREFIRVTHEAYRKRCGRDFGKTVPGIFTDEPNYGPTFLWARERGIPWTEKLPAVFSKRYGYDLLARLPELFFDVEGLEVSQARYHYHDCVTRLFVDAFARQIGEWCAGNKLLFTGHVLLEEMLSTQTAVVGSAMRFYEHMQAPGIDLLTEHLREYDTAKCAVSVARQFGRKWRLTETYGCTGWDFPFAGHKALGDWQAALGINLRCQHLSWYTMEGQAKRDYPASVFYQSPWWEAYRTVEDYFARIHSVMTRGAEVRDLLVIHPIESAWLGVRLGWNQSEYIRRQDETLIKLRDALLAAHIDFDYGDEDILSRHGVAQRRAGRPALVVGKADYRAVIVPPMTTIRSTTLSLLRKFRDFGGGVVFAGEPPRYVDALPSDEALDFARNCASAPASSPKLAESVEASARRLSIADAGGEEIAAVLYLLREDRDRYYLFLCNTGHDPADVPGLHDPTMACERNAAFPDVVIRGFADCEGDPIELDPRDGGMYAAHAQRQSGMWAISTNLPALGSRLFVVPKKRKGGARLPVRPILRTESCEKFGNGGTWAIVLSEHNCLVLDRPRCRIGQGRWKSADEILRVDDAVRDALGIARRGGEMVQPWACEMPRNPRCVPVSLKYNFRVDAPASGGLWLAIERPDLYRISVNGAALSSESDCGWWVDKSLRMIPVAPALIRKGGNEIALQCEYDESHPGLEIIYLLGNFGVAVDGTSVTMTTFPDKLAIGDWTKQGLPFYSGTVSYVRNISGMFAAVKSGGRRLFIETPHYKGVAVRVWVNGRAAGMIAWEPNELDITDHIDGDEVELRIEVLGHRRNSHGPLHHALPHTKWTGPGEFITTGKSWTHQYQLVSCGLMAEPILSLRRES
ncbi:MAG: glycosyl hydrolase [Candidatus Sumerlaeota bacterium]|nr:glycosyl hydrolase [Candidatus Sumerlaeota bacterium]